MNPPLPLKVLGLLLLFGGLVSAADLLEETIAAGGEVGLPMMGCTSDDKVMGVVITVRKEGQPAPAWPKMFPDVDPNSTPAESPGHVTEAWIVNFTDQKKLARIPNATEGWSANGVKAHWGPDQEGWRFGVLDVNARFGNRDLMVINDDGTESELLSIRDLLDKNIAPLLEAAGQKPERYTIDYTVTKFLNAPTSLADELVAQIAYLAEVPKSEDPIFEGDFHLNISRNPRGRAVVEITKVHMNKEVALAEATGPASVTDPAPPDEFSEMRALWNGRAKDGEWRSERVDLPPGEDGGKRFVIGWLDANVLQRLLSVDSQGDGNEIISIFYWKEGLLTSVFELRSGAATGISDVGEASEVYNFLDEKLVQWDRSGDTKTSVDPSDPSFQSQGAEVLKQSRELAAPIYEKIGAD